MTEELAKILLVDDEPNVLSGLKRQLHGRFKVFTAESGVKGLEVLHQHGPFPVVVSDMRMPQMNGATFLSKVKQSHPFTMRILLTGQTDIEAAMVAVNEGQIFRFLMKPCPPDSLICTLDSAVEQNRLLSVEKELLEKTLRGSIKVLTDILSMVNPLAFSRSSRVRRYVNHMAAKLQLPGKWQFELAAMLSQIGCVTVPHEILSKVYSRQSLNDKEKEMYSAHPDIGADLIAKIPRLRAVSQIIRSQHTTVATTGDLKSLDSEILGAQMLKVALGLEKEVAGGKSIKQAVDALRKSSGQYNNELLVLLEDTKEAPAEETRKLIRAQELTRNMMIDEDILATNGALIVAKGQEVSDVMLARLQLMARNEALKEPFRVVIQSS